MEENRITNNFKDSEHLSKFTRLLTLEGDVLYYDFSKTHLNDSDVLRMLKKIEDLKIYDRISEMRGKIKVNFTENKTALHMFLRDAAILNALKHDEKYFSNIDEKNDIYNELIKIRNLTERLHRGELKGFTGKKIKHVVNIGIGGSNLGPKMVCESLRAYAETGVSVHFISNIDSINTKTVLDEINIEEALFIVVSKTFTTKETIMNATLVINYMHSKLRIPKSDIIKHHFMGVTSNIKKAKEFGLDNVLFMGDYVGGRFSAWSPAGMIISLYLGFSNFMEFLRGASIADQHFITLKGTTNIPILHAIVELFYNTELNYNNKCIVVYDHYAKAIYEHLQQLEMESNGKSVNRNNMKIDKSCLIIWGGVGTDVQHSFFQMLHQGTQKVLTEFIGVLKPQPCHLSLTHHEILLANCIAQSKALMEGESNEDKHREFEGGKPSISIFMTRIKPMSLGALIAMHEHKIFIQGAFWDINSFDQFGVELGKKTADDIYNKLINAGIGDDDSTNSILDLYRKYK